MCDQAKKRELLNTVYTPLEQKRAEFAAALSRENFPCASGFYNGHYTKTDSKTYEMDYFPIPVISVTNLCDIEIGLDIISVSAKMKREDVLSYSFDKMKEYPFEAYGVEGFLDDYYREGDSVETLKKRISQCGENEIGFSFSFGFNTDIADVIALINLLKTEGFYY